MDDDSFQELLDEIAKRFRRMEQAGQDREAEMERLLSDLEKKWGEPDPVIPEVDETWTRADVRKLARLLVKRAKLLNKLKGVLTLEAIADLECAIALDALRGKAK